MNGPCFWTIPRGKKTIALTNLVWCLLSEKSTVSHFINTPQPDQNGHHLANNIFKCIFLMKMLQLFKILFKFLANGRMIMEWKLVQVMAKHQLSTFTALFQYLIRRSYCNISQSIEAMRFVFSMIWSIWNLTGISTAMLPMCLSNFKAMNLNYPSCGFEASWDLTIGHLIRYWSGAQVTISHKNIERHTVDTIVSWPNPKQWVLTIYIASLWRNDIKYECICMLPEKM